MESGCGFAATARLRRTGYIIPRTRPGIQMASLARIIPPQVAPQQPGGGCFSKGGPQPGGGVSRKVVLNQAGVFLERWSSTRRGCFSKGGVALGLVGVFLETELKHPSGSPNHDTLSRNTPLVLQTMTPFRETPHGQTFPPLQLLPSRLVPSEG